MHKKKDAYTYASVNYKGNFFAGEKCYFPAYAKVRLTHQIIVNREIVHAYFHYSTSSSNWHGSTPIEIIKATMKDIELLSAKLVVVNPATPERIVKEYNTVDFLSLQKTHERQLKS